MDYTLIAEAGGLAKAGKSKNCLDMRDLEISKTNRKQREDIKIRKTVRSPICMIPGCTKKAQEGVHHVVKKSGIIIDHPYNYLNACDLHHLQCDKYQISQVDQFELIAIKNKITTEELLKTLEDFAKVSLFVDNGRVKVKKLVIAKAKKNVEL